MKKILSLLLFVAMMATTSMTAFAAVEETPEWTWTGNLDTYKGIVRISNIDDLNAVYDTWKNTNKYDNYKLLEIKGDITISQYYDFTKANGSALSINFKGSEPKTIQKDATLKAKSIEITAWLLENNGTIILTQPSTASGGLFKKISSDENYGSPGLTNNGTIKMLNTDKILCHSEVVDKYPITNNGIIQTPTGTVTFSRESGANANGDVYLNPESTGFITGFPKYITNPDTSSDSTLTMNGVVIPAPTYTVTIPTTIDFGDCEKAMANDTVENKIKEITVDGLSVTHSNLFANEKKVTVAMGSDFNIKNGENALNFTLYDGETKLSDKAVLITANPTVSDTNVNETKSLTAKLDKTQIKKSGIYQGIVTFTVSLSDIA